MTRGPGSTRPFLRNREAGRLEPGTRGVGRWGPLQLPVMLTHVMPHPGHHG
jgi:hypothetical protein